MKKTIISIALFLFASSVFADPESTSIDRKITQIRAYEGMVLIYFSPAFENNQGCTSTSKSTFQLSNLESSGSKNMFELLKNAAETGKTVALSVNGCSGQFPKIYRVDVGY